MKTILAAIIASFFFTPATTFVEKWVIEKNSNLSIEGRSNISSFRCDVTEYLHADTILFNMNEVHQQALTAKGGLTINVNRFDCHQKYIDSDLRKTLKAKECPFLKIDLLSIGNFLTGNKSVKGNVAITLAGVTRKIDVDYIIQNGSEGNIHLYGSRQVLFSDFNLIPPRKLAGLIKVEEQINVRFLLILRPLANNATTKLP
jgi:hypothetical protein